MDELREKVKTIILRKLRSLKLEVPEEEDEGYEEFLEYIEQVIDEVEYSIRNYCNIDTVPEALKYTWANMAVDYIRWVIGLAETGGIPAPGTSDVETFMSSVKVGDTTVGFSAVTGSMTKATQDVGHTLRLDEFLMNYEDSLNKFRRVVW